MDGARVFVIGAGFSHAFGYPTADRLLPLLWKRLTPGWKKDFERVVQFHHPLWTGKRLGLPPIEILLTELYVNRDLLPALTLGGTFSPSRLDQVIDDLLLAMANWFHDIHRTNSKIDLRTAFVDFLKHPSAQVISFNWDYELDEGIYGNVTKECYGLGAWPAACPVLLKPHGSLNWYPGKTGKHIRSDLREQIWSPVNSEDEDVDRVYCFRRWRAPRSTKRRYLPLIVPPTYIKRFDAMFRTIWDRCVRVLSTAREVYFIGYSLPEADWHSRFILRCGFVNQVKGVPIGGRRKRPTGKAKVCVVNPERSAYERTCDVVGWKCEWIRKPWQQWLDGVA